MTASPRIDKFESFQEAISRVPEGTHSVLFNNGVLLVNAGSEGSQRIDYEREELRRGDGRNRILKVFEAAEALRLDRQELLTITSIPSHTVYGLNTRVDRKEEARIVIEAHTEPPQRVEVTASTFHPNKLVEAAKDLLTTMNMIKEPNRTPLSPRLQKRKN